MNQTRLGSLIEAATNVLIGLGISLTANAIFFPLVLGKTPTFAENAALAVIYTLISITRGYCVRRWFNHRLRAALGSKQL